MGLVRENIIGQNELKFLNDNIHGFIKDEDNQIIESKKTMIFEREIKNDGRERILEVHKSPVFDESDNIIGIVGLLKDVTEIRKNQEDIRRFAYTDYLTGLLNRRGLNRYIENEIDKNENSRLVVMFVDLDNFKKLNDSFGHYYGDKALKLIGSKLSGFCKKAQCARIGGDEFVIVWENISETQKIKESADRILELLNNEFRRGDRSIQISGSIGILICNQKNFNYEDLLLKGDAALYKAKEKGKNQYVFYTDALEDELNFNLQIEADLRKAVTNNEVDIKYQPQYTPEKELVGFEALFRWKNNKYKDIPVIDLIKIIEKYDVMDSIGDYVIKKSLIFAKEINKKSKRKLVVSVNISALQIMGNMFVEKFKSILTEVGVNPEFVGIEITETVLLENINENIKKIDELKRLGVTIALDDFGTGYSSLNYLVKLPISKVKIDKSFVWGMGIGSEYIKLVNLITEISHSLGLPVVAEGVENIEELELLEEMDVDLIQGYLFSVPLDREEAMKIVIEG